MSDEDSKSLPTRDGIATGHAMENRMLYSVGGQDGIRTRLHIAADGTTTLLKTRAGMPDFQTRKPPSSVMDEMVYMESGVHVGLASSGDEVPATWKGLDLVGESKAFHKWVSAGPGLIGRHIKGSLDDGPSDAMKTHAKMNVALKIPPSLFSGKMRLFMQAQYGSIASRGYSIEDLGPLPKEKLMTAGNGPIVRYEDHAPTINGSVDSNGGTGDKNLYRLRYKPSEYEPEINIGFTAGDSCGVFYSSGSYWLVSIKKSGTVFSTTVYPIRPDKKVKAIKRKIKSLRANPPQDGYKKKLAQLEGYLFAYCSIDTASPFVLNSFDIGSDRNPFAYGWKFNSDGNEAKIIVHGYSGTFSPGGAGTVAWESMTVTMNLGFSPSPSVTAGNFTCSFSSNDHGRWVDAERTLIYTPGREGINEESEYPFSLYLVYLSDQDWSGEEPQTSTNTPIYGFYIDDVWTPVLYDHYAVTDFDVEFTLDCSPGAYDATLAFNPDSHWEGANNQASSHYSWSPPQSGPIIVWRGSEASSGKLVYEEIHKAGDHYKLAFGGQSVSGREATGNAPTYSDKRTVYEWERVSVQPTNETGATDLILTDDSETQALISGREGFHQLDLQYRQYSNNNSYMIWDGAGPASYITEKIVVSGTVTDYVREHKGDRISLVIPCGDSESILILKEDSSDEWEVTQKRNQLETIPTKTKTEYTFIGYANSNYPPPPGDEWPSPGYKDVYNFTAYFDAPGGGPTNLIDTERLKPGTLTSKYMTKTAVKECPKKPEHDLFWRPPIQYYEPGMYSMTSVLDHFNCSEGIRSDSGMDGRTRFCGWI